MHKWLLNGGKIGKNTLNAKMHKNLGKMKKQQKMYLKRINRDLIATPKLSKEISISVKSEIENKNLIERTKRVKSLIDWINVWNINILPNSH